MLGCVAVGQAGPSVFATLKAGWAAAGFHHMSIPRFNFTSEQWRGEVVWTRAQGWTWDQHAVLQWPWKTWRMKIFRRS